MILTFGSDLELMYEQFLRTREVVKLSPFKDMIEGEINPGPNVTSKEDIKDWIKKTFATIYREYSGFSQYRRVSEIVPPQTPLVRAPCFRGTRAELSLLN